MNRVRQWLCGLWLKISRRDVQSSVFVTRPKSQRPPNERSQTRNDDLEQLHDDVFGERESADEEIHFQQITAQGVFAEKSETWFRDGDALRSVVKRGRIISCSGAVVSADSIQAVCGVCHGFEAGLIRCSACAIPLCHLHALIFEQQEQKLHFCPHHYARAAASRNTWESSPSRRRLA